MNKTELTDTIKREKLIVIVRGVAEDKIICLASAMLKGGIRCMEVTLDQNSTDGNRATLKSISALCDRYGDKMHIGVGTAMTPGQVRDAAAAGAEYVISPNVNSAVIAETLKHDLVSIPGALTPSEIAFAYETGADFVKVFPAFAMGPDYFKAVSAPLSHIPLLAVGGIRPESVPLYLKAGACGFGVGGNLVNKEWLLEGRFDLLTAEAMRYRDAVEGK